MSAFLLALLLAAALVLCWGLTALGLPGNWLMVVLAALYAWLAPQQPPTSVSWTVVVILLALAVLGEILEFAAGAMGTARAGGSRRGVAMALGGSLIGGFVGLIVGAPIPLIGSLVGAVLFAGVGALVGALVGEIWTGRDLVLSWRVAKRAFWGRLFGTLGKVIVGGLMTLLAILALVL